MTKTVHTPADEADFNLESLPPVPDAPRTVGPAAAGALGLLLLGLGAAIGVALAVGAEPLQGYALSAVKLGLTPGVAAVAGVVALAVGLAAAGLSGLMRRTIDTLDLASDPVPLLERLEDRLARVESSQMEADQRLLRDLRGALLPIADRIGALESAVSAVRVSVEDEGDTSSNAMWRLAASMDQVRAQLDQRLSEQLATYEQHLAEGLARANTEHVDALERALQASQEHLAQRTQEWVDQQQPVVEKAGATTPSQEPTAEPAAEVVAEGPSVEQPVAGEGPKLAVKRPASVPPAAPAATHTSKPAENPLGVFDELDEHGRPKAPMPTPSDVAPREAPTSPMPDIYGGAEKLVDIDDIQAAHPRPKRDPQRSPRIDT